MVHRCTLQIYGITNYCHIYLESEDQAEDKKGKVEKIADGIADGYDELNSVVTSATSNLIRGTGKMIDKTISESKKGLAEDRKHISKATKVTFGGGKGIIEGGKEAVKGLNDNVKNLGDSTKATTEAVFDKKIKTTKKKNETKFRFYTTCLSRQSLCE